MLFNIANDEEIELDRVYIDVPIKNDGLPEDFPLRSGEMWRAEVVLETGQIVNWPKGRSDKVFLKVVDMGTYLLTGPEHCYEIECDYVPHGVIPGSYGDYIILEINEEGVITNWPSPEEIDILEFLLK